ncbi:hypothetical protein M9Y10_025711 [Tritrichomonas musculus]|uniref:Uncharacterized protein n=1 Tax=Tritrichomonas musculus TaxID=1915356 RepID=A0ABR2H9F0_9EUKA
MDSKTNNHPPSEIEKFFSKLPCPVFITVFSSFIFIYFLGFIFSRGIQVYPIYNEIMPDDDCPECRVFNDTKASITERQFRIIYQVVSKLDITHANAWRLLRIRIYGPIFSQEMRANTDNCGLYAFGTKHSAMHFELIQEGPTTVELYCLDKLLLTVSNDVSRYNRNTQSTLFHTSIKEVSNICRVEEQNDEHFVFFSQSNVFNFTNNRQYTYIPRLLHRRQPYEQYINETNAITINNAFRIEYTNQDLLTMTYHELFEKVMLVIFVQSHFGQTIVFSYHKNMNSNNSPYFELFRKITDGKLKESPSNYRNIFCYQKMTTIPNHKKIQELTESEYEMLRSSAVPRDQQRGDKIYLSTNFNLADELDKDYNIYFFGEEKIVPPTQSPSPSPSMSPEPSPSPSQSPAPTQKAKTEAKRTNATSSHSKSTKAKETNELHNKTSKSKLTNKLNTNFESKSANKNETKLESSKTKLVNKTNSGSKSTNKNSDSKSNESKSSNSRLNNINSHSNSSLDKADSLNSTLNDNDPANSTLRSDLTSSNSSFTDEELSSPVLLSYPEHNHPENFSLQQKIEMLSSAKGLIAVDDNENVLHAFWMPRESPLILILPPVRTSMSKAAQRINATGRKIIILHGEKEGAEIPNEYETLAAKCMNDEEAANSDDCDPVFEEMKFKFDTKKVLEIVNNL